MNEQEARDAVRPLGNCSPLPRLVDDGPEWGLERAAWPHAPVGKTYPGKPLTDEEYAELSRATREPGGLCGVRLWLSWPGSLEIAEASAQSVAEFAERIGFSALHIQVKEMER